MNYRHDYHAGNFADVLKHLLLALVIDYMKRKDAPFRVIDTHAGCGRYLLSSDQAAKTGEWRGGIGRLLGPDVPPLPAPVEKAMAPYLDAVRAENSESLLHIYPGSPLIAQRLIRSQDVLVANELHEADRAGLKSAIGRDRRVKLLSIDGWLALKSLLPPKERRAVVLIDPPFEREGEFARLADGLKEALARFEAGIFLAWYPIKESKLVAEFHRAIATAVATDLLRVELMIRGRISPDRLYGCGLVVANAPYTLCDHLRGVLPDLTFRLADGAGAFHRLGYLDRTVHARPAHSAGSHRRKGAKALKTER